MLKTIISAVALATIAIIPAFALEVTKTATIAATPDAVWKTIGPFCGISHWHPVVESCAISRNGDMEQRTLHLKGGGLLVEAQQSRDDKKMSYTYTILSGPLPVEDYKSTIMVEKDGSGSKVTWTGSFKAKGADDDKAKEAIAGVYEGGLKSIADKTK